MIISVILLGVAAVWLVGWKPRVNSRELGDYGTARFLDGHIQDAWHPSAKLHQDEPPILELTFHTITKANTDFYDRDPDRSAAALGSLTSSTTAGNVAGMGGAETAREKLENMQTWIDDPDSGMINEWSAYEWATQYNRTHDEKIVIKYNEKGN